jgi:hypothetical protein
MGVVLNCSDIVKPFLNYVAGAGGMCYLIDVNQTQSVREFGLRLILNANGEFGNPVSPSIPEGFQVCILSGPVAVYSFSRRSGQIFLSGNKQGRAPFGCELVAPR